ncbi:MAG: nuclear transport factor 2 family protein [bacterium]
MKSFEDLSSHTKRIAFFSLIALLACAPGLAQTPNHAREENLRLEQEVGAAVAQFANAFAKADTAVLRSLLTDDYVHTNANGGVLDKTRWLAFAKTRRADLDSGKVRIDTYRNDELRIRIYGNTAVVTGLNTTIGFRDGKEWKMRLRFTNVWVKRDGCWQRVAFHDSASEQ